MLAPQKRSEPPVCKCSVASVLQVNETKNPDVCQRLGSRFIGKHVRSDTEPRSAVTQYTHAIPKPTEPSAMARCSRCSNMRWLEYIGNTSWLKQVWAVGRRSSVADPVGVISNGGERDANPPGGSWDDPVANWSSSDSSSCPIPAMLAQNHRRTRRDRDPTGSELRLPRGRCTTNAAELVLHLPRGSASRVQLLCHHKSQWNGMIRGRRRATHR